MPPSRVARPITLANTMRRSSVRVTSRISGPCVRNSYKPMRWLKLRRAALVALSASPIPAPNRDPPVSIAIACPRRSRLLEAIANAVECLDHVEVVIGLLELLAQPLDVAVDGAVVDVHLVVVGGVHQRIARLDYARASGECLQDEEL